MTKSQQCSKNQMNLLYLYALLYVYVQKKIEHVKCYKLQYHNHHDHVQLRYWTIKLTSVFDVT